MRYAIAGDRQISCNILIFLIEQGFMPLALMISEEKIASHSDKLITIAGLDQSFIYRGIEVNLAENIEKLKDLELDYIFGLHFPYIISKELLAIPKIGFLNLHPAYLPFNKGWHTPSWALQEDTLYGATLHFMSEELDEGDIVHQVKLNIDVEDTADSLYQKALALEETVFKEAFNDLVKLNPARVKQNSKGTAHSKKDLKKVQEIYLENLVKTSDLLKKFKALTTNNINEAAFFKSDGDRYAVQVKITKI